MTTSQRLGYGDYLRFRDLILERSGLDFPEKKRRDLEIGLFKALKEAPNGVADLNSYFHFLQSGAAKAEWDRLLSLLTIGETYFFRDSAQMDGLLTHVLPELIAQKRARAAASAGLSASPIPQLRLWSAGCASGEEPYSLAMALHQLIPDIDRWRIYILATDINPEALARARRAEYSDWSFREERARGLRDRYFITKNKRHRLKPEICRMVTFAQQNLAEDNFPSAATNTLAMDLILCRNVTIYFPEAVTRQLINRFYQALTNGGWLAVGHSEPSLTIYQAFQIRNFPGTILYQKTGQPSPWPVQWPSLAPKEDSLLSVSPPTITPYFETDHSAGNQHVPPSAPPSPAKTDRPVDDQTPLAQANALLAEDRIAAATSLLSRKLSEAKKIEQDAAWYVPACGLLARLYADQGQWAKARHWGQRAIELDTLQGEAYYVLALVDEQDDRFEAAIDNLKKVIYLDRTRPLPYFNLAMMYKKTAQPDRARQSLNNLSRILAGWPPEKAIPDTDGTTAAELLTVARQLLADLK